MPHAPGEDFRPSGRIGGRDSVQAGGRARAGRKPGPQKRFLVESSLVGRRRPPGAGSSRVRYTDAVEDQTTPDPVAI